MKHTSIHIIGVPEKGAEAIFEDIAVKFPNLEKKIFRSRKHKKFQTGPNQTGSHQETL